MLTFQEMISASPFHDADILAGWDGKERAFSSSEETIGISNQPTLLLLPYTNGNLIQLPDYLSAHSVQGILFYGKEHPLPPSSSMIKEADSYHKPVLWLGESNPIVIQKKLTDLQELKKMGLYHYIWEQSSRYWQETLNNEGIETLLSRLRSVLGQHLLLADSTFKLDPVSGQNLFEDSLDTLKTLYHQQRKAKDETISFIKSSSGHAYLLFHLRSNDVHYGFVVIQEQSNMMVDVCMEQITYASQAILSYFKTNEIVLKVHQSYKQQFLYNLLYNNLESEESLFSLGKQWGWDFTKPAQLMVMKITARKDTHQYAEDIENITSASRSIIQTSYLHCILHPIQGNIVMIIFDSFSDSLKNRKKGMLTLAKNIQQKIEETYPDYECQIGLGRHYPSNMLLYKSFYEAKVALELSNYGFTRSLVQHFEDIGFPRLLSNIPNHLLQEYHKETLADLTLLDKEDEELYMKTIEAFYRHNGDISQSAEELFIHPNTLRNRIKKIESVLDADFNQFEDLFRIFVALTINKMLN
ncbi:helix-turn-helix domain-containing protein [Bacillus sp. FJAT-27251]|uniref:PucR family transcriptional regulator n=1 Tax=Bacillus sp. FJAT-27251 TaxID=1684142 RepID=UPI0006A77429|nr:helix-turn-helix domain-containing protein [Bacillus sp. FJAT-27251]